MNVLFDLSGRRAMVLGGTTGINLGIAQSLTRAGVRAGVAQALADAGARHGPMGVRVSGTVTACDGGAQNRPTPMITAAVQQVQAS